jgi:hypothetical protein
MCGLNDQDFDARDILGRKVTIRPENVDLMIDTMRSEIVVPPSPVSEPPSPRLPPSSAPSRDSEPDASVPSTTPTPTIATIVSASNGPVAMAPSSGPTVVDSQSTCVVWHAFWDTLDLNGLCWNSPDPHRPTIPMFPGTCARTRPVVRVSLNPIRVLPVAAFGSRPVVAAPLHRPPVPIPNSMHPFAYTLQQQQSVLQQRWGPSLLPGTDPATVYALISTYGPAVASQMLRQQQQQQQQQMLAAARTAAGSESSVSAVRLPVVAPVLPPSLLAANTPLPHQSTSVARSGSAPSSVHEELKPTAGSAVPTTTAATPTSGQSGPVPPMLPMQRAMPIKKVVFDARAEYQRPLLFFWNIGNMHWNFFRIRLGLRKEIELFEPMGYVVGVAYVGPCLCCSHVIVFLPVVHNHEAGKRACRCGHSPTR